jgi:hypothetical protein
LPKEATARDVAQPSFPSFSFSNRARALKMVSNDTDARFPPNVGIRAMEIYFPSTFVDQQALGALYPFSIDSCCLFVVTSLHSI